jgi:hypothetical protein
MSPGEGPTEDPVLSQYLDLAGTRGAHLKKPVGDVMEKIDSTELARLPIVGAHLRTAGDGGDAAGPSDGPAQPVRVSGFAHVDPAPPAASDVAAKARVSMVAPASVVVRDPAVTSAPMVAPAPMVPRAPVKPILTVVAPAPAVVPAPVESVAMVAPGPPVTVAEPVAAFESSEPVATKDPVTVETAGEATQEASPADLAELIGAVLADPPGRHAKAEVAVPTAVRPQSTSAAEVEEEASPVRLDAILEAEFGVYVEMASAPPPVPAFDAWTPPVEPIVEPAFEPISEPVVGPVFKRMPDPELASVAEFFAAELPAPASTLETVSSPVSRPLDDEW